MINTVVKNNGEKVPFSPEKLNKWAEFASSYNVNWSAVALEAYRKCYDGCTTLELHKAMIDACVEKEDAKHLHMAGRLLIGTIYKEAFGGFRKIPTLKAFYEKMVSIGHWAVMDYSDEEFEELNKTLDHTIDITYNYTTLRQMKDKYLITNRVEGRCLESPQFMFMGMAMQNMEKMPKERRIEDVKNAYKYLEELKINLPTPMLVNLRTNHKGYASCSVHVTSDDVQSLSVSDHIAYMMTCASAGIGANIRTRSKGDPVKGGTVVHMGKLPYLRMLQSAVHANLQACYSDDTEILTNKGFVLFKELTDEHLVAQVNDNSEITFIKPIKRMEYDYKGEMINFTSKGRRINMGLLVTPNHEMTYRRNIHAPMENRMNDLLSEGYLTLDKKHAFSPKIERMEAEHFEPSRLNVLQRGGYLKQDSRTFSDLDALQVAYVCDGLTKHTDNFGYSFRFSKKRKVVRLSEILDRLGIKYSLSLQKTGVFSFYVNVGFELHKDFTKYLPDFNNIDAKWAEDCLREFGHWDGSYTCDSSKDSMSFVTVEESTSNVISSLASLCGARVTESVYPAKHDKCKDQYRSYITFKSNYYTGRGLKKEKVDYDGKVYCVEVPTNNIIVRRDGMVNVCGNSRGGAANISYSCLDPEIDDLLVLKNPTTVLQKRIRDIDYTMLVNRLFVEKVARNEEWMLISELRAKDLYDAFYSEDYQLFKKIYEKYLNSDVKKTIVKARDIAVKALTEGAETGRIYITYIDEMNRHTPFKESIYSSNLCLAGDQLVSTDKGLLTAKELYDLGEELLTHDGKKINKTSKMNLIERNVPVFEIRLENGMKHKVTGYHKVLTQRGVIECKDLLVGEDMVIINKQMGLFGSRSDMKDEAFLLGLFEGDGTTSGDSVMLDIYENKTLHLEEVIQNKFNTIHQKYTNGSYEVKNQTGEVIGTRSFEPAKFADAICSIGKKRLGSVVMGPKYLNFKKGEIPRWLRESDRETILEYIKGVFYTDGTFNITNSNKGSPAYLSLTSVNKEYLEQLQIVLNNLGYSFNLHKCYDAGYKVLPDGKGGTQEYYCQESWRLVCGNKNNILDFERDTGFITLRGKQDQIEDREYRDNSKKRSRVWEVVYVGNEDVYCPTVDSEEHLFVTNGIITHNCVEIGLPTKPFKNMMDLYSNEPEGEIGLCSLASIVVGRVDNDEYEQVAYYTALIIDNVIDLMDYPFPSLKRTAQARRSIGVGITNLAHEMAKNHLSYASTEGKNYIHFLAERHSYFLHKASLRLAQEKGNCEWTHKTKYPEGWLPIDTYNRNVDTIVSMGLMYDWETLRKDIITQGGLRHSVLEAMMPVESSSQLTNTTNGLYPIRSLKVMKTSSTNKNLLLAPDMEELANVYDIAWLLDSKDLIDAYAIVQKFTGQAISADLYLNLKEEGTISTKKLLQDFIYMAKMGCKTRYYINSASGIIHQSFVDTVEDKGCAGGACTL